MTIQRMTIRNGVLYTDRDTSFEVFSIDELFVKFGEYIVDFSAIRDNILYIEIVKE